MWKLRFVAAIVIAAAGGAHCPASAKVGAPRHEITRFETVYL
jgi:hypothetical protein